ILQNPDANPYERQRSSSREVSLRMRPQGLGEVENALSEKSNLHLCLARINLALPMLRDDLLFNFLRKAHLTSVSSVPAIRRKQAESRGCGRGKGSNDAGYLSRSLAMRR